MSAMYILTQYDTNNSEDSLLITIQKVTQNFRMTIPFLTEILQRILSEKNIAARLCRQRCYCRSDVTVPFLKLPKDCKKLRSAASVFPRMTRCRCQVSWKSVKPFKSLNVEYRNSHPDSILMSTYFSF